MDVFENLLKECDYDPEETRFIANGFRNGFDIGYRGEIENIQRVAPNLKLTVGNKTVLWNMLMKEVKAGHYVGPFKKPPFKNFIQSPMGLVPKDKGKSVHLIFHLSYPRTGSSINSETPSDWCSVNYPDFSDAIKICMREIQEFGACTIAKTDIKSTFRNVCIKKLQWCLLTMAVQSPIDNQWYFFFDKCLPFGASISCSHFQRISNGLAHITRCKTHETS